MNTEQKLLLLNLNKSQYLLQERIATFFLDHGGIIFGGYVRDKILHDRHAETFYGTWKDSEDISKYTDVNFHPSTIYRLLLANDIDVFIRKDGAYIDSLYEELRKDGFSVLRTIIKSQYFFEIPIIHHKLEIKPSIAFGLPIKLKVDLLFTTMDCYPPFGQGDLMCNAFVMDQYGIKMSNETGSGVGVCGAIKRKTIEIETFEALLELKTEIIRIEQDEDLFTPRAILKRKIKFSRILDMQLRGWKIVNIVDYEVVELTAREIEEPERPICSICQESLELGKSYTSIVVGLLFMLNVSNPIF